jgi:phosphotriesterase-related protein
MATVNTVLGPINTAELGFTLMHEHVMCGFAGVFRDYPELLGDNMMERVVTDLKRAKEGGVDTIVDATTIDLGRDINLLVEASRRSGVNIIACSGWWMDIPRFFVGISPDQLADVFTREVEKGISGTDVKAGILKAASDMAGVTAEGEAILRGVARAHHRTGVPIMVHSYSPGRVGERQVAILKEEGVDLGRVKMDHSNDTTDVEYLVWLLEQGCYLGMDRYPGRNVSPLGRTKTMKALIDAGYADRICPSHDRLAVHVMAAFPMISEEERLRMNPHGFLYMKEAVFPLLKELGVSEEIVDTLCIKGPRNFFEGV